MLDVIALTASSVLAFYAISVTLFKLSIGETVIWKQAFVVDASSLVILGFVLTAYYKLDLGFPRAPGTTGGYVELDDVEWLVVIAVIIGQIVFIRHTEVSGPAPHKMMNMNGKVCIVTGSNGGIGFEMAKTLALEGARVILACRNEQSANEAVAAIREAVAKKRATQSSVSGDLPDLEHMVSAMKVDLGSFESVRAFVDKLEDAHVEEVDVLINNAGFMGLNRTLTVDGQETTLQVNCLSSTLLSLLLLPRLQQSTFESGGRIVNIGSSTCIFSSRKGVSAFPIDDLTSKNSYSVHNTYATSKWALALTTFQLHRLLSQVGERKVNVNYVSPGSMRTGIIRDLPLFFRLGRYLVAPYEKTVRQGTFTAIHVATSQLVDKVGGKFYEHCQEVETPPATMDPHLAEQFWEKVVKIIDVDLSSVGL